MIIRTALPAELPEIGDIRVAAYRADGFLSATSQYAAILHGLGQDGNGDVLVAVAGEAAAGHGHARVLVQPGPWPRRPSGARTGR